MTAEDVHIGDPVAFGRAANRFHLVLGEFVESKALHLALQQQYWPLEKLTDRVQRAEDEAYHRRANGEPHRAHSRFIDLVRAGDAEAAAAFWEAHVKKAGDSLLSHEVDAETVIDLLG